MTTLVRTSALVACGVALAAAVCWWWIGRARLAPGAGAVEPAADIDEAMRMQDA